MPSDEKSAGGGEMQNCMQFVNVNRSPGRKACVWPLELGNNSSLQQAANINLIRENPVLTMGVFKFTYSVLSCASITHLTQVKHKQMYNAHQINREVGFCSSSPLIGGITCPKRCRRLLRGMLPMWGSKIKTPAHCNLVLMGLNLTLREEWDPQETRLVVQNLYPETSILIREAYAISLNW